MDGDKVKVTVMFRGREMVHTSRGRDQLKEVTRQLGNLAKMENPPRMEGRFMSMILVGDREAIAEFKRQEEARKVEEGAEAGATEGEAALESTAEEAGSESGGAEESEAAEQDQ